MARFWQKSQSLLIFIVFFSLSHHAIGTEQTHKDEQYTTPNKVTAQLRLYIESENHLSWAPDLNWTALKQFYSERDYRVAWRTPMGHTEAAKTLRDQLVNAHLDALQPKEYHIEAIRYLWRARKPRSRARLDLLLTDAFLRYSVELRAGYQFPRQADPRWYISSPKVEPVSLLQEALATNSLLPLLGELAPPHQQYERLRTALANYRQLIAQHPSWPKVIAEGHLRLGDRHPAVTNLRTRLHIEGFLSDTTAVHPELYDADIEDAVLRFQKQYGHKVDGIVGPITRRSLNISLSTRVEQLQHNMERWRWLPRQLGDRYVMVNMAGYRLHLVENGDTTMQMRVIIGKPYKGTPAFANDISYLQLNPSWNIPPRIAKQDLLPKIQKDPSFIKDNDIRVYASWRENASELNAGDINWQAFDEDTFRYKLTQAPGSQNSLGRIKFMFPNSWNIYLHDTPDKKLFNREVRTFSSGCIRLENPLLLASKLTGKTHDDLQSRIDSGDTQTIRLKRKVPIYLMYWTAWVNDDGGVQFRDDIYARNHNIATAPLLISPNS
jgi:murein L,D-transpeptidase YcbB/YkuD